MILSDIIPHSTFATIATVSGRESVEKVYGFLQANKPVLDMFEDIIVVYNITPTCTPEDAYEFQDMWVRVFGSNTEGLNKVTPLIQPINLGHMFGTIDLDEKCLKYCQTKYLWKANDDMLIGEKLLSKEIDEEKNFLYLPGFSYETLLNAGNTNNLIKSYEDFFYTPQSTFFILDTTKVRMLYGDDVEDKREAYLSQKEIYPNLKPWEMNFPDGLKFSCEDHLSRTTKYLSKQNLLDEKLFRSLVDFVKYNRTGDPSHKQLYLKDLGICHYHDYNSGVYEI